MKRLLLAACLMLAVATITTAQTQRVATVTIAASASLSSAVRLQGGTLAKIRVPVMTAANLSILESTDGVTFDPVYDDYGVLVTIVTGDGTAARWIQLDAGSKWAGRWYKFQSGTVASPVVQVAERTITVVYQ